jgi:hypothetical protein
MANNYAGNEYKRRILAFFLDFRTLFGQAPELPDFNQAYSAPSGLKCRQNKPFTIKKPHGAAVLWPFW